MIPEFSIGLFIGHRIYVSAPYVKIKCKDNVQFS